MNRLSCLALAGLALFAAPALSQDHGSDGAGEIIVTGTRREASGPLAVVLQPPVIGLKRQADSAVRRIEIVSDSREPDMRKREVQAMLLAALERARREGMSLVTGHYEVVEVTRDNWRDAFPALAGNPAADLDEDEDDDDDDGYDDDEESRPQSAFEDDGSTATVRLLVKTRLEGSVASAQQKITAFVKGIPPMGRSQIEQKGALGLTIINPEQYRDEIYRRVAAGATHAASFYGADYGVTMTGLDRDVAWAQVSNTEIFLYIPYSFTVSK